MLPINQEILFTRQRHEAKKAGLHYDIRFVVGDKAYSFATKKELPESGKAILLYEQPIHTAHYALSERVEIPEGQYGAGVTTLDFVRKAKVGERSTPTQMTIHSGKDRFLLKKLEDEKYGEQAWLFKNLGEGNKYLEKAAMLVTQYQCPTTKKTKWIPEAHTVPHGYVKTGKSLYRRKGQKAGLRKSAENLQPHQDHALDVLDREGGVLMHHSTGSGKTRSFLTAVARSQKNDPTGKSLIVAPASLVSNVDKEILKHKLKIDRSRLKVLSYEKATRDVDELSKDKYSLIAFDEGHKLRNVSSKRTQALTELATKADKRLVATATANYNHISDISPLLNIVAGDKVLPTDRKEMENRYIQKVVTKPGFIDKLLGKPDEETQELKNHKHLKEVLDKYVSYYDSKTDPKAADKFPSVSEETVETPMSKKQTQMYKFVEGNVPFMLRMKIRHNLPLDKKEKASLNQFSTGVRQVSNGYRHLVNDGDAEFTPKIHEATTRLAKRMKDDKNFRGVVYSNYLDAGLHEYSRKLRSMKIPHGLYTGGLNKKEKDQIVSDYNEGRSPVLLISSSGAEGLDLKGTKLTQVMEPHFNKSKIQQVMGRGARYGSHEHLPKEERHMHVEHYLSTYEKPMWGKTPYSIDKYLSENSDDKDLVFDQVRNLMKND